MDLDEIFRHIKIYEMLFKKHIPELYQHFKAMEISPEHYLLDWFMTIFGRSLNMEICCHVFDCFVLEGEVFLYKTALGILKYHSKMLKKSSFEECLTMIRHIPRVCTHSNNSKNPCIQLLNRESTKRIFLLP